MKNRRAINTHLRLKARSIPQTFHGYYYPANQRALSWIKGSFAEANWDTKTKTYLLEFENSPEGVYVDIKW
ncbi:hypothetical protein KUH03_32900 [Sphingobacterium sp. E70]|uniref:hypothetical protein n=1 Tax=Sphingobacterium sp. E70 TaxID=2853439 RepID=UPI00211CD851|nr:hypothetical protein [Sphingobacterium sp. E70]ULT23892.1 hypothetical protein KUH03_32900 [Sphingobacterium sp. E70]